MNLTLDEVDYLLLYTLYNQFIAQFQLNGTNYIIYRITISIVNAYCFQFQFYLKRSHKLSFWTPYMLILSIQITAPLLFLHIIFLFFSIFFIFFLFFSFFAFLFYFYAFIFYFFPFLSYFLHLFSIFFPFLSYLFSFYW